MRALTPGAAQHLSEELRSDDARVAPVEGPLESAGHQEAAARKSSGTRTVSSVPVRTAT